MRVDCSGSGDTSQVSITFEEALDDSLKDVLSPGTRLVMMCDSGDITSDHQPTFQDDRVGAYRFLVIRETTIDGATVSNLTVIAAAPPSTRLVSITATPLHRQL